MSWWFLIPLLIGQHDTFRQSVPRNQTRRDPVLTEFGLTGAGYGSPIPEVHGEGRVAGQIIWAAPVRAVEHVTVERQEYEFLFFFEETQEIRHVSYTYHASFAVAFCEGPVHVQRILADGHVVYDASTAAGSAPSAPAVITGDSGTALGQIVNQVLGVLQQFQQAAQTGPSVRIYRGDETQQPDPAITTQAGASVTPAFRGTCYAVFADLDLERFGNRMPSRIEAEIVGTATLPTREGTVLASTEGNYLPDWANFQGLATPYFHRGVIDPGNAVKLRKLRYDAGTFARLGFVRDYFDAGRSILLNNTAHGKDAVFNNWDPTLIGLPLGQIDNSYTSFSTEDSALFWSRFGPAGDTPVTYVSWSRRVEHVFAPLAGDEYLGVFTQQGDHVYFVRVTANADIYRVYYWNARTRAAAPSILLDGVSAVGPSNVIVWIAASANYWWLLTKSSGSADATLKKYAQAGTTLAGSWTVTLGSGINFRGARVVDETANEVLILMQSGGTVHLVRVLDGVKTTLSSTLPDQGGIYPIAPAWSDRLVWYATSSAATTFFTGPYVPTWVRWGDTITVALTARQLLETYAQRAGWQLADLDYTAAFHNVLGFVRNARVPAREVIDTICAAYGLTHRERDHKLEVVVRGAAAAVGAIPEADLGARADGESMPERLPIERRIDAETPTEVVVHYLDRTYSYEELSQYSRRAGSALQVEDVRLSIVMYAADASRIAHRTLDDIWSANGLTTRIAVGRKWARLDPGDVVNATADGYTHLLNLGDITIDGYVIECAASLADSDLPTQAASGAAVTPAAVPEPPGPTRAEFLALPPIHPGDTGAGTYVAACGAYGSWSGASIARSRDGGASYVPVAGGLISLASYIGQTETKLPEWPPERGDWDYSNSITVQIVAGTPPSKTTEQVLAREGWWLIGRELVGVTTVTALGSQRFTLSGLLRNRRGTDRVNRLHVAGERVVYLGAGLMRVPADLTDYAVPRQYLIDSVEGPHPTVRHDVTDDELQIRPLAPAHVGGGRLGDGAVIVSWARQDRLAFDWLDGADAPLSDSPEAYSIDTYGQAFTIGGVTIAANATISTSTNSFLSVGQKIHLQSPTSMREIDGILLTITQVLSGSSYLCGLDTTAYAAYAGGGTLRRYGRTYTAGAPTLTIPAADQTSDFGSAQNPIAVAVHQVSPTVGRGHARTAVI